MLHEKNLLIIKNIFLFAAIIYITLFVVQRITNGLLVCLKYHSQEKTKVDSFSQGIKFLLRDIYEFYMYYIPTKEIIVDKKLARKIQFITIISTVLIFYQYHNSILLYIYIPLIWFVIPSGVLDFLKRLLPVFILLKLLLVGMIFNYFGLMVPFSESLQGLSIGSLFIITLNFIYKKIRNREGVAIGDIIYIAVCGAWFGLEGVAFIFLFSSFMAFFMNFFKSKKNIGFLLKNTIPYGPFISAGIILYIAFKKNFNDILSF